MTENADHSVFEDEGPGYLVSVSDIMAGLLFIFIITLVAFVIHFQDAEQKAVQIEQERKQKVRQLEVKSKKQDVLLNRLTNNRAVRKKLLTDIDRELRERGVKVKVDQERGVLRLTEKAVRFQRGKSDLGDEAKRNLDVIAEVLDRLLPCYAVAAQKIEDCDVNTIGKLEAVFIEGHTDNTKFPGTAFTNWDLSAKRAIVTYQYILNRQPSLGQLVNRRNEVLFSVAGYADQRPVPGHAHVVPTDDENNRRIDMRFIMTPPTKEDAAIVEDIHRQGVY